MPSSALRSKSSVKSFAKRSTSVRVRRFDVAAGNGNASLAAARRWCDVIATMHVPALLERARERAQAERLDIEFRKADAEALPFPDAEFDAVVLTFGVMFTPDQDRAAAELVRVCKHGGKIGLAKWTPEGFIGQLFKTIGKHIAPPVGTKSPGLWGTRPRITEMFGPQAASITAEQRNFVFRYRSPGHLVEIFKTYYGPLLKTFAALDLAGQLALEHDVIELIAKLIRAVDGSVVYRANTWKSWLPGGNANNHAGLAFRQNQPIAWRLNQ